MDKENQRKQFIKELLKEQQEERDKKNIIIIVSKDGRNYMKPVHVCFSNDYILETLNCSDDEVGIMNLRNISPHVRDSFILLYNKNAVSEDKNEIASTLAKHRLKTNSFLRGTVIYCDSNDLYDWL